MSKANNLTDFLTDIATTIRNTDGTSSTINPQNFSTRIVNYQNKTVTPSTSQQSITKDSGYMALGTVTVNAVASGTATVQNRTSGGTAVGYGKEVSLTAGYYDAQKFYNSVGAVSGSIGLSNNTSGSATAGISNTDSMAEISSTSGKTAGTDYFRVKATATGTAGSVTPRYTVNTAGYIGSTVTGSATSVSVSSDTTGKTINVIKAAITNNTTLPSGSSSSGTINAGSYIKIEPGYNKNTLYYQAASNPTLNGDAIEANVLSGKTFYSNSYTKKTGSMTNNGSVTEYVGYGNSYTIPAGYHDGTGTVSNSDEPGTIDVTDLTITPNALSGTWDSTNNKYVVSQASKTATMQSTVTTAGYVSSTVGTKNTGTATVKAPSNLEIAKATFEVSGASVKTTSSGAGYIPASTTVGTVGNHSGSSYGTAGSLSISKVNVTTSSSDSSGISITPSATGVSRQYNVTTAGYIGTGVYGTADGTLSAAAQYITDITVPATKTLNSVTLTPGQTTTTLTTLTLNGTATAITNLVNYGTIGSATTTVSSVTSNNAGNIYIPHKFSGSGNVYVAPYTSGSTFTYYKIISSGALATGSATPSASYATLSSAGSPATSVTSQYFKITPTASVGTAGWISSISNGTVQNYTVRSVSGSSGSNMMFNTNCTLSTTNTSGISVSATSGGYTVATAGWIGAGTYGNASTGTKYITDFTVSSGKTLSYIDNYGAISDLINRDTGGINIENAGAVDVDNSGQVNVDTANDSSVTIMAGRDYGYDLVRYVYDSSDTGTLTVQVPYDDNGEVGYKTVINADLSATEDGAYMPIEDGGLYSTSGGSTTNCFYGTGYRINSGWVDSGSATARTSSAILSGTASSLALNSGAITNVYGTGTIAYLGTGSGSGTLNISNNGSSSGYYGYVNITNNTTSYGRVRIGGTTDSASNIYFIGLNGHIPSGKTLTALANNGTITTYSNGGGISTYTNTGTITNMTGSRTITNLGTTSATGTLTISNLGKSSSYISELNVSENRYGRVSITSGNLYSSSNPLHLYSRELISKSASTTTTFRYLMVNTPAACNWTFSRKAYPYTTASTRSNGTISTTGSPQYIADTSTTTAQYITLCILFNGYIANSQTLSLVFSSSTSYSASSAYTQNITIPATSNGVLFRIIRRNTTYYDIYPTFFY